MRQISDRAFIADEVMRASVLEMLLEHAVESPRFVAVAVPAVGNVFRAVAREVVGLALHWADAGVLFCEHVSTWYVSVE